MKLFFNEEQIQNEKNRIDIEEDDLVFFAESLEGEGKHFILTGNAVIEGETYHEFQIEFELTQVPALSDIDHIMEMDWEWYDYLC